MKALELGQSVLGRVEDPVLVLEEGVALLKGRTISPQLAIEAGVVPQSREIVAVAGPADSSDGATVACRLLLVDSRNVRSHGLRAC